MADDTSKAGGPDRQPINGRESREAQEAREASGVRVRADKSIATEQAGRAVAAVSDRAAAPEPHLKRRRG